MLSGREMAAEVVNGVFDWGMNRVQYRAKILLG